jgi:hypothetical protein
VKVWVLTALFLVGCSTSRKEKAFQKSLDVPESANPTVEVEAPPKLLEKFEVAPLDEVPKKVEAPKTPKKKLKQKTQADSKTKVTPAEQVSEQKPVEEKVPKIPKNYPPHLLEVNARAEQTWKQYRPNHRTDEKIFLDIHYLGMTVGKIMVTNRGKRVIDGKEVWHFHSRFKSAPFYSNIYELDDTVDTYVTTDNFLSIRYSLIQRESKQDVDDLQLHDRDKLRTYWFYKRKKSDGEVKNKEKKEYIPYFSVDPFSVLFLYQGLPLKTGDVYEIPVINKGKVLILKSEVEGREVIDTDKKDDVKAIRVHATTKYTGETLKSGDMYFWLSDDGKHTLLKAQAKIKIGSVTADVVDAK